MYDTCTTQLFGTRAFVCAKYGRRLERSSMTDTMDVESFRALFLEFARAHNVIDRAEAPLVAKMCEVL